MRTIMSAAFAAACLVGSLPVVSADKPIATADGEQQGMTLQVNELKVSNGTVMIKFTIVNNGNKDFDPDNLSDRSIPHYDAHSISGVYLIDANNKKKYLVMYDSENQCVCSRSAANLSAKSSANFWAKFPAPPDSVTKIGVVVPHFQPLDDVPLSR